jgi:TolA-binding protein
MEYQASIGAYLEFQQSPQAYSSEYFPYSHYGLGYAYYMNNQLAEASNALRRFSREKNVTPSRRRDGMLRLADVYFLQRQYPQALEFYGRTNDDFDGENTYAYFQKALCLGLIGEDRKKITELDNLVKRAPKSPLAIDARFEKASTLIKLEDYNAAINIYQAFINEHPNHPNVPRAKLNMSLAYRNSSRYDEAIDLLMEVARTYPNTPEAVEAIKFGQNVFREADRMGDYVSWVQSSGEGGNVEQGRLDSALYFSAFDRYSEGKYESSVNGFKDYNTRFPSGLFSHAATYYIADSYYRLEKDDEALDYFEQVLTNKRSSFYDRALDRAASIRYRKKDYPVAANYYRQILERNPMEEQVLLSKERLMRIAFFQSDWPKLEDWSRQVLQSNPEQAKLLRDARWSYALSLYQQHKRPEADSALAQIITHYQGNEAAQARYYLAEFYFEDNRFEETKTAVYTLIEKFPGEVVLRDKGLLLLARVFIEEEDYFQAEYSLDFVIQSNADAESVDQARQIKAALKEIQEQAEAGDENDAWEVSPGQPAEKNSIEEDNLSEEENATDDE